MNSFTGWSQRLGSIYKELLRQLKTSKPAKYDISVDRMERWPTVLSRVKNEQTKDTKEAGRQNQR